VTRRAAAAVLGAAALVLSSPVAAQAPGPVVVPPEIAADCSVDVTSELAAWIASVPDGSTLELAAGGCYRIDGTVTVAERSNLVLDGKGATLRAGSEGDQERRHLRFVGGSNVEVRDLVVRGAQPNTRVGPEDYREDRAFQHGFALQGVDGFTIDRVRVYDVFGDFVYVGPGGGRPSRDVTVRDSTFSGSGRQGIAVTSGERLTFRGNELRGVAMSFFDLEPNRSGDAARQIEITENVTGRAAGFWLMAPATGAVGDVSIAGNVMRTRTAGLFWVIGTRDTRAGPVTVAGNRFLVGDAVYGAAEIGAFYFERCAAVSITDNRVRFPTRTPVRAVDTRDCTGVSVEGNTFAGAAEADGPTASS
jgi:hypothetical protein